MSYPRKTVNDQFCHEEGDALLRSVGKTIKRVLHATDAVARIRGDEFVVLIQDLDTQDLLTLLAATSRSIILAIS